MLTVTPDKGLPSSPLTLPDTGTLCAETEKEDTSKRRIMQFRKKAVCLILRRLLKQRLVLAGRSGWDTLDLQLFIFIFQQLVLWLFRPAFFNSGKSFPV